MMSLLTDLDINPDESINRDEYESGPCPYCLIILIKAVL